MGVEKQDLFSAKNGQSGARMALSGLWRVVTDGDASLISQFSDV